MWLFFFLLYLLITGHWASVVLDRIFDLKNKFTTKVLGAFATFTTLGSISGLVILFLPLTPPVLIGIFILNALIYFCLYRWIRKIGINQLFDLQKKEVLEPVSFLTKTGSTVFLFLAVYGFCLLYTSQTNNTIFSPWQVIKPQYIFIFLASTFILGLLVFSKLKTGIIILFLMVQTFLLHSYLPLTHQLIYGADGWRHIANEQRLLDGKQFLEPNIIDSDGQKFVSSAIGQLSYGNFWSLNVMVAKVFKTDLITVTKWFLPGLWSLLFPILLFEIGTALGWKKSRSLFFSWLGLLPFTWQASGSFTLPVGFSFLFWLLLILLLLKRLSLPNKFQALILVGAGISLVSGYILYFILFWLAWFVAEILLRLKNGSGNNLSSQWNRYVLPAITVAAIFVIPSIELLVGYSNFQSRLDWLAQIKQVIGNFLGIYIASGPRPHDIPYGNIIFNQTPLSSFVPNILTDWRWWMMGFMICFFGIILYSLAYVRKLKTVLSQWLVIMWIGIMGGYIITNYFLGGSHILARRLDAVAALFVMILFALSVYELGLKIKQYLFKDNFKLVKYPIQTVGILVLSVAIAASYSLGPDTNTVSADEYRAMEYVWSQDKSEASHCVVADTYPLLALEAISSKEIIGGGFPIDSNFGQPELQGLYQNFAYGLNIYNQSALQLYRSFPSCWFVGRVENEKTAALRGKHEFTENPLKGAVVENFFNSTLVIQFLKN